jgi:tetratricopeptide (TPR) repeat protein
MRRRFYKRLPRLVLAATLVIGCAVVLKAALLRREVTTDSADAYALYLKGFERWQSYQLDAADSCWVAATTLDPEFAMAWGRRATLAYQRGQMASARKHVARAESLAEHLSSLERVRIRWFRAGIEDDTPTKLACIREVLRKHPRDVEALFCTYQLHIEAGETEAAIRSLQEILKVEPTYITAYNYLGYGLADLGRFEEALEALRKYAFVYSDEPNPHDSLGELYERIGRYDEAEGEYARALAADTTFFWARVHNARLLGAVGRYREALEATRQGQGRLSPLSRKQLRNCTVGTLLSAGRYGEALRMMDSMRDSLFQPATWLLCRAEILKEMGDVAGVNATRDSLLARLTAGGGETSAMSTGYLRMLIQTLSCEVQGNWGGAADSLQAWLDHGHPSWDGRLWALLRLADDLGRARRFEDALAAAGKILADNPNQARALCFRARALAELGRGAEALEAWRRVADILDRADPAEPMREEASRRLAIAGSP